LNAQLEKLKSLENALDDLKNDSQVEKIPNRKFLSRHIKQGLQEVSDKYKILNTLPVETDSIEFVPVNNPNLLLGHLFTSAHPHTSEVVDLPHNIVHNTKVDFTIQTRNFKGEKCTKGGHHILVELKSASGNITNAEVKDNNDGSYIVSFVAKDAGHLKIFVFINNKLITQDPYSVIVVRNYQIISKPRNCKIINNNDSMCSPYGCAFNKDGMLWAVVDYGNHYVYLYNSQDELVKKVGSEGSGSGHFKEPRYVAFDDENHLYVVDSGNSRVQKFEYRSSENYEYALEFGNDDGDGKLSGPGGIAVHNDKVYVTDYVENQRIVVFLTNGQHHNSFGSELLRGPTDVTVNTNSQLLCLHHCIFTFTLNGNYVDSFGTKGSDRGKLEDPHALTSDHNGFILVADSGNHRVSVFDKFGNYINCFGVKGFNLSELCNPYGVALSPEDKIYVSEHFGERIQIFSNY